MNKKKDFVSFSCFGLVEWSNVHNLTHVSDNIKVVYD